MPWTLNGIILFMFEIPAFQIVLTVYLYFLCSYLC